MELEKLLQDHGIMPGNIRDDESFVEFEQRTTWFEAMTKALQRHSEFMRPELADDYADMEYGYPQPPWWDWPTPGGGEEPEGPGNYFCNYCWFTAKTERRFGKNDYCDGQICFPFSSVFCMTPEDTDAYLAAGSPRYVYDEASTESWLSGFANAYSAAEWSWHIIKATGMNEGESAPQLVVAKKKLRGSAFMCIEPANGAEWPVGKFEVEITAVDMYGNTCRARETLECVFDCCDVESNPSYVAMTLDEDNTPTAIAPGGSITVYVLNGCPPFTWAVSGAGYSFASATTTERSNVLSLIDNEEDQCLSDTADPFCAITVTDSCGTVVGPDSASGSPKNTAGQWNAGTAGCTYPGVADEMTVVSGGFFFILYKYGSESASPYRPWRQYHSIGGGCWASEAICLEKCDPIVSCLTDSQVIVPCQENAWMCTTSWKSSCPSTSWIYYWVC